MQDGSGTESRGNGLLWALVGCGALLFLGLCAALGVGVFLFLRDGAPGLQDQPPIAVPGVPPQPIPPQPIPPIQPPSGPSFVLEADVSQVTGTLAGRVTGSCRFVVEQTELRGSPACRTQIVCDSLLVYGGPTAGYFPCRVDAGRRSVSGADTETTANDSDAAMTVDTDARTLQIRDDATGANGEFTLTATIR